MTNINLVLLTALNSFQFHPFLWMFTVSFQFNLVSLRVGLWLLQTFSDVFSNNKCCNTSHSQWAQIILLHSTEIDQTTRSSRLGWYGNHSFATTFLCSMYICFINFSTCTQWRRANNLNVYTNSILHCKIQPINKRVHKSSLQLKKNIQQFPSRSYTSIVIATVAG